ncbi:hypothetical protein F4778DRAFT_778169 [Xylariomycetidae sp. FL2044]|nr:hypothetical protein F4778DRAFT_778169 [Xylariomycetidae sp. FL2044]
MGTFLRVDNPGSDLPDPSDIDIDASAEPNYILPQGLAVVVLVFAVFFFVASLVAVVLRAWIRARAHAFGVDDGLMIGGLVLFLADAGIVAYATFQGLGTVDENIPMMMQQNGIKVKKHSSSPEKNPSLVVKQPRINNDLGSQFTMIWQLFYVASLLLIKASICVTLLRVTIHTPHRVAIYATIALSVAISLVGLIGLLCLCRPIEGNWIPGAGECAPRSVLIILNYLISVGAIVTDWACAIIPVFILWNAQMKRKAKISVAIVLGIGSLASASTFARLPYLQYYGNNDNFLCNIVLWSVFEGGIGLVAGSLPMLRVYFKRWIGSSGKPSKTAGLSGRGPPTIGGTPAGNNRHTSGRRNTLTATAAGTGGGGTGVAAGTSWLSTTVASRYGDDGRDWERLEEISTNSQQSEEEEEEEENARNIKKNAGLTVHRTLMSSMRCRI